MPIIVDHKVGSSPIRGVLTLGGLPMFLANCLQRAFSYDRLNLRFGTASATAYFCSIALCTSHKADLQTTCSFGQGGLIPDLRSFAAKAPAPLLTDHKDSPNLPLGLLNLSCGSASNLPFAARANSGLVRTHATLAKASLRHTDTDVPYLGWIACPGVLLKKTIQLSARNLLPRLQRTANLL